MAGVFIVSLDCEGKWGMADHLQPYHHELLTDRALADVYDRIVGLFARYEISASFAFVMAFTLDDSERKDFAGELDRRAGAGEDPWLRYHWDELNAGRTQGWFQPHAFDVVQADGRHEIACHSFCHRPMGDKSLSPEGARAELAAAARIASRKGITPRTFIFPRNEIGNLRALKGAGYVGFREKLNRPDGRIGRIARLAEEINMRPALHYRKPPQDGLVPIPAGYFFNWRFGARRHIPPSVTLARWKSLLDRATAKDAVAHLWLHPHNLITGPGTAESLERVLAHAARLRDEGRLEVRTQEQFCDGVEAGLLEARAALA